MQPTIWISILHYKDLERTKACLSSLLSLDYPAKNILVTNNGSPDGPIDQISSEFPDCQVLNLSSNLGFAGGSNASIKYCLEQGAQWIWILNNDTTVAADSLKIMVAAAQKNDRAGLLGASIYTPNNGQLHRSGFGQIDFGKAKTFEKAAVNAQLDTINCDWLSGCNLLIRADAFKEISGFDEDFFLYFEDVDLCHRLKKLGWECLLVPAASINHEGGASTIGKLSIWRSYYYTRNRLLFFLKYCKGIAAIPVLFAVITHILRHCLVLPFRGENGRRQLKAELLGLRDYCLKKFGKADCLDF